jgi:hypothetical protein
MSLAAPACRAAFALALVLPACGATGGAGTTTGGGGGGGGDPTSSSSGGSGAPTKGGQVSVSSYTLDYGAGPKSTYVVSAYFYQLAVPDGGAGGGSPGGCDVTTTGDCTLTLCGGSSSGGAVLGPTPQAGTLTVSTPTASASLVPAGSAYAPVTGQTVFWAPGETVTAVASGGDIPAFTLTAPAPTRLEVSAPTFPATGALPVDTTHDLAFAWSGSSAGKVVAGLANNAGTSTLSCQFDPGAGSGVLPQALLSQIPKGMGVMSVSVTSQSKTQVGGFDLTLYASTDGTVNGKLSGGAILLQ